MKCLDETIEAMAAGTLDDPAKADAAEHVRQCPACRELLRQTVVLYRALGPVFAQESRQECPAGEELALYDEGELDAAARGRIKQHLKVCVRCAADLHELKAEREEILQAERESAEAEAIQIVYHAAAAIPAIQAWVGRAARGACQFLDTIRLDRLMPRAAQEAVMAADTGSGFQRQVLTQPESPFEVEMAQFGNEVRVTLHTKAGMAEYADCLVRLILTEGQTVKLARLVSVKAEKGGCVLRPNEVTACVPDSQPLAAEVELVNAREIVHGLAGQGVAEALIGLLNHSDPPVRRSAVDLLANSDIARAAEAIARLQDDPDAIVRAAVVRALRRLAED